ncbi:adenine phosphoribosyltransferase [Lentisphaerota bacterium ZTH]|nr:adenine phosphoribosyltransferase [Lentisphaerota bacterium]WET07425.1 adenine phosphoribosyltransferase [Lentisphaerota bacterium ZTH]
MSLEKIEAALRKVPDFPKPGIVYIDITPLLQDKDLFANIVDIMSEKYIDNPPKYIVGIEARGFILGSAMAYKLGCGFVPVRKKGKLPYNTLSVKYELEYGEAEVEVHEDAVQPGDSVLLVDDLLATGGTAAAAVELLEKLGANILGVDFIVELGFLPGREALAKYPIRSLILEK